MHIKNHSSSCLFLSPISLFFVWKYVYFPNIYSDPQTNRFVVSQLFSVATQIGHFKLGLKPGKLYVRLSIITLSHQSTYVSSGIIRHYVLAFACLHFALPDTIVVNSYKELCITLVAAVNSFARVLNYKLADWGRWRCESSLFYSY